MAKSIRQQIADLNEQIEKLTVKRTALEAQAASEVNTDDVQAGRTITFNYGKGDGKKVLTGLVLGRKNAEPGTKGGDLVKVAVGEGFDAIIATIYPSQVTAIAPVEAAAE